MNWMKWVGIGIAAAIVITGIVLHILQPTISFAWTELFCAGSFVGGGLAGYFLGKYFERKKTITKEKQVLND